MIPMLALHFGDDPFWFSASSSYLGCEWRRCSLAKSITACFLCVSRLNLLLLPPSPRRLSSVPLTEQLLEFMHQLPAFANMTMSVRRELCAVMVFAVVERAGTIVLNDGEEVCDSLLCSHQYRRPLFCPDFNSFSIFVFLSRAELVSPFYTNESSSIWCFFCSVNSEWGTALITRLLDN